jgi:hypothetical protein
MKDVVYDQLINSKLGIVADFVCQAYLLRHPARFWSGNYFITETHLRGEHPELFEALNRLRSLPVQILGGDSMSIDFEKRCFYVVKDVLLTDASSFHDRYRQSKRKARIRVGDVHALLRKRDSHPLDKVKQGERG